MAVDYCRNCRKFVDCDILGIDPVFVAVMMISVIAELINAYCLCNQIKSNQIEVIHV